MTNRNLLRINGHDVTPSRRNIEKILSYIPIGPVEDCWEWGGATKSDGYGRFYFYRGGRTFEIGAHRVVQCLLVETVPEGMVVDHLCQNHICVNPMHHEIVTLAENSRRSGLRKTHCKRGHEFDEENTRVDSVGARQCRACYEEVGRERQRAYYHANKETYKQRTELYWKRKLGISVGPACGEISNGGAACGRPRGHEGRHYPQRKSDS